MNRVLNTAAGASLGALAMANAVLIFGPMMIHGEVTAWEDIVAIRIVEFALMILFALFGLLVMYKNIKHNAVL